MRSMRSLGVEALAVLRRHARQSPRRPSGNVGAQAAEAAALSKDPAYVREAREVAALMEQLRGPR